MDKEIIDKVMFDNFLMSVPTMVVDAKDRKTISAYGNIDVNDLRSAVDAFKKVPEYGELLKQVKKQKEVIDKAIQLLEDDNICADIRRLKPKWNENKYGVEYELLDILKEVSE